MAIVASLPRFPARTPLLFEEQGPGCTVKFFLVHLPEVVVFGILAIRAHLQNEQ